MRISGKYVVDSITSHLEFIEGHSKAVEYGCNRAHTECFTRLQYKLEPDKWYAIKINEIVREDSLSTGMISLDLKVDLMYDPTSDELEERDPLGSMSPEEYGTQLMEVITKLAKGCNDQAKDVADSVGEDAPHFVLWDKNIVIKAHDMGVALFRIAKMKNDSNYGLDRAQKIASEALERINNYDKEDEQ